MFKSVFAKYVTVLMAVIICGFALLLVIVTSIVGNHSEHNQTQLMETATEVTRLYLEDRERIDADAGSLNRFLETVVGEEEELFVLLLSERGDVLAESRKEAGETVNTYLPDTLMPTVLQDGSFVGECGDAYLYAVALHDQKGEFFGAVVAVNTELRWGHTVTDLAGTVVTSALLVLLALL